MSHDHTHSHSHPHSHDHDHGHSHDHHHDHNSEMSMAEKLNTLLTHWIDHNDSHMQNYLSWAAKAQDAGLDDVADALKAAGNLSQTVTEKLKRGLAALE